MAKRRIVLTYDEDDESPDPTTYADLAHAVWMTAQVAMPSGNFKVRRDDGATNAALNERWEDLGKRVRWGD